MARWRFASLYQGMLQAAHLVQQRWQGMAQRLFASPRERDAYTRGLTAPPLPVTETVAGLHTTVANTSPAAPQLEQGHGAYHLPSRINWAQTPRARRTRAGRYYLIIPFRHYSAQRGIRAQASSAAARRNMLPRAVYEVARLLRPGQYLTAGPSQGRAVHAPGLQPYVPRLPQNIRPGYTHAAPQERLQRVPGARQGAGSYLTFRTMTSESPGWWVPSRPRRPVAAETVRDVTTEVQQVLGAAAAADVTAHLQAQLGPQGGAS